MSKTLHLFVCPLKLSVPRLIVRAHTVRGTLVDNMSHLSSRIAAFGIVIERGLIERSFSFFLPFFFFFVDKDGPTRIMSLPIRRSAVMYAAAVL